MQERPGILAEDEELDGMFRLGAYDGVDEHASQRALEPALDPTPHVATVNSRAIPTAPAVQAICVAVARVEDVVLGGAGEAVPATAPGDDVATAFAVYTIGAATAEEEIVARIAEGSIAVDQVAPAVAVEAVSARPAVDAVVPRPTPDQVGSSDPSM